MCSTLAVLPLFFNSTPFSRLNQRRRLNYWGNAKTIPRCSSVSRREKVSQSTSEKHIFNIAKNQIDVIKKFFIELEAFTRPGSVAGAEGAMSDRYANLPESVKGPSQMLGRMSPGCEGTNGVFPKCTFGCKPCYHSKSANRVPVDGNHTVVEIARQMKLLSEQRGPVAHAQLIGGEVSLLNPSDHARALEVMSFYGRIPMSFSHGDFDYEYLRALAVHPNGQRRFGRIDFAAHFDKFMRGRRTIVEPKSEVELNEHRQKFLSMFDRLRHEHGVRSYCAHNMTVQRGNVGEVSQVVADILSFRNDENFRMLSFQPASETGARRVEGMSVDGDEVWREIERGAGTRLPFKLFKMGHPSCNRVCFCARFGSRVVPFFDDESEDDVRYRNLLMNEFGNIVLVQWKLFLKITRVMAQRPILLAATASWALRFFQKCGVTTLFRHIFEFRLITFVMHSFMNASEVSEAWGLIEQGHDSKSVSSVASAEIVETVERLLSCSYGMGKVEEGRVIPACVQHSVYDEDENVRLAQQLGQR